MGAYNTRPNAFEVVFSVLFPTADNSPANNTMGQCLNKEQGRVVFATPDANESNATMKTATAESDTDVPNSTDEPAARMPSGFKIGGLSGGGTKSLLLAHYSTPSSIDTAKLTTIYRLPDDKYTTEDDVLKDRGIQLLDMFDEGGFAKVFKARRTTEPPTMMACKMVDIGTDLTDNSKLADIKNELFVLEKIKHPHVVRMYEHFIINEQLYIFMDYADFGNLYRFMYLHKGPMAESEAKKPFSQIVSGIAYMHAQKIAHRDLKLSNILLKTLPDGNIVILIADFGLSRVVYRRKTGLLSCKSYCGTPNYMAPELKQRKRYNAFDIDLYALGVMLFVMVQSTYPFDAQDDDKALEQAIKPTPDIQWNEDAPLKEPCISLLRSLLEPSAVKRMSMRELLANKWNSVEMTAISHTLPPLEELPKKVVTRRFSSPADDVRIRVSCKTFKSSTVKRHPKSADGSKSKRTKSTGLGKRSASKSAGGRKSVCSRTSRKKSADRNSISGKRSKPTSCEVPSKTNAKRATSQETISKVKVKVSKGSNFSSSVKGGKATGTKG